MTSLQGCSSAAAAMHTLCRPWSIEMVARQQGHLAGALQWQPAAMPVEPPGLLRGWLGAVAQVWLQL